MTVSAIRKSVVTKASPSRAFELFTERMGEWFPPRCSRSPNPGGKIILEPFTNGRWFERDAHGAETDWGKVLIWAPPERLVLCWQIDKHDAFDAELHTEVELIFRSDAAGGTVIELEHRNVERFGKDAQRIKTVAAGWTCVLVQFGAFADAETVLEKYPPAECRSPIAHAFRN